MYLIDTSIWIDLFNNNSTDFIKTLYAKKQTAITGVIYMEVLQGAKNTSLFNKLKNILNQQKFYSLQDNLKSYENSANIYMKCRQKGITIRSTIDCLIACCAIENDLILVHNDNDFIKIAEIVSDLQQQQI
ncbi:MAG: hypothetical protein DRQ51_00240 [Gammaproteobacteria bacterium]|nr:MAG: hypothetical protein DRQ51_00240 [Gammaproteobacteria bacterium]